LIGRLSNCLSCQLMFHLFLSVLNVTPLSFSLFFLFGPRCPIQEAKSWNYISLFVHHAQDFEASVLLFVCISFLCQLARGRSLFSLVCGCPYVLLFSIRVVPVFSSNDPLLVIAKISPVTRVPESWDLFSRPPPHSPHYALFCILPKAPFNPLGGGGFFSKGNPLSCF